ncbi:hypothetical protein CYLTODRAFT_416235 [Cylindrobasidium torrendii FP15055 ss-10]|uniref:RNA-binding domain-containing protein n=1 Tax=Cylindrobasidium torrendii FP15055 ss-10 TaxID=1314674 RepID=A0A0D7BXL5_9AGAR|nr:hypothetical protein CYLTODRAFT_416235 [Cylindrobasidium torrendii FP15055 ss-10]
MHHSHLKRPNLGGFFEPDNDNISSTQKASIDDAKLSHYNAGVVRKSRKEKEAEAAEAKRREEEEDNARAYAEFIDTFESGPAKPPSAAAFVRAGQHAPAGISRQGPTHAFNRSPSPEAPVPRAKGRRAMDSFLEEIKKEQAVREAKYARQAPGKSALAMAAYDSQSGSRDRGDSQTTNIFVANLPTSVTEQSLGMFFARLGPVASVKVMWPRTDGTMGPGTDMTASRRAKNTGLSGFVSYMTREDAEDAVRELDGSEWGGSVLRVGWSKSVTIPARPLYVNSLHKRKERSHSRDDRSRSRSRSRSPKRKRARSRAHSYSRSPSPDSTDEAGQVTNTFIRAVAVAVKGQGEDYEESLWKRERNNPKYAFMRPSHNKHHIYRDLLVDRRPASPEFEDDGYHSAYSTDSAEDSEREHSSKHVLGKYARRRFETMLRGLTGKRGEIARCMAFSLEHAEAAHEVADIIIASLLVDSTPVPRKVARLYLICDILHNSASSVPSAWKFRQEFQARLGIVFDHLANIYHSFPGRMTAGTFKKQITAVVDVWDDWIVFPADFLQELRKRLDGKPLTGELDAARTQDKGKQREEQESRFKKTAFKAATTAPVEDLDGAPMEDDVDGAPMEDDVDGAPMENDLDGEPMADDPDIDGAPMDDLDGEPLQDDNLDGQAIVDDDLDGVPMDEESDVEDGPL